ncbi:cell division protein FtsQ/DivIB [Polaribacter sargassicola]|uniref:cell division protein FtsQ/DivIB n=1 Tax=Polaribacter sargassicola TaxID=2836891 RepID=UPI001F35E6B7|nr:cell division protein FtsQ/DivIB [Polaribacter sp. DS7-9]MCG1036099.1 cell division protein FtsQ [Polaribacter sp. DS7-9]
MKFKKFLKYILFFLLIISLSFLCSFSSKRNYNKKVKEVVVEFDAGDNNFLTHAMVNKLLIQNDSTVKNQTKSVINLHDLEKKVSKNPFVKSAAVFLTINGVLKSTIKQRTPIARVINNDNSYYVDKEGVSFPLSDNFTARVMLVFGVESDDDIKEVLPFLSIVYNDKFLKEEVIGIERKSNGEYQLSVRSGDYKIDFGKLTEIDVKIKKLKAFYNTVFEDKTIKDYKRINVKYHNQVVCTK